MPRDGSLNYRPLFGDGSPGYPRHRQDWYVEPDWAVEALFRAEPFRGTVLDPACGRGTIPTVARTFGLRAIGTDLVGRGFHRGGADFFERTRPIDNIVSNPPYKLADRFALHALSLARSKVALLLRLAFLEGQTRFERLYRDHPPARVLVFSARVSMPPGDSHQKAKGGKMPFCWVIWYRGYRGEPRLGWVG